MLNECVNNLQLQKLHILSFPIYNEQQKRRFIYSYRIWNWSIGNIFLWIYLKTAMCIRCFWRHYLKICLSARPYKYVKRVSPKFESNKICNDFSPKNKDGYLQRAWWKFKCCFCRWRLAYLLIQNVIITDSVVLWKIQKFDWLIPETKLHSWLHNRALCSYLATLRLLCQRENNPHFSGTY